MALLVLDPEEAAKSVAVRLTTIRRCDAYIAAVAKRYKGIKPFDDAVAAAGGADELARSLARAEGK